MYQYFLTYNPSDPYPHMATFSRTDIPLKICRLFPQNLCSLTPLTPLIYNSFGMGIVCVLLFMSCLRDPAQKNRLGFFGKLLKFKSFLVNNLGGKKWAENDDFLLVLRILL